MPCMHMLLSAFRRPRRRCPFLLPFFILLPVVVVDFVGTIDNKPSSTRVAPNPLTTRDRVFFASMHWNNEALIRSHWNAAVLDLVEYFGADNIYISIIEGGSWDNTKGALRDLDVKLGELGVERSIEMYNATHEDEVGRAPGPHQGGWIRTSRGRLELRRIPYLANIRNQVMGNLQKVAERKQGKRRFGKILWSNDVIFTVRPLSFLGVEYRPST